MNNLIILDFETYFDKEITLKKLNYSEYIPQATPFIIATIRNNKLTCTDEIAKHLDLIDWNNTTVVGHNLLFDALVLKHWYNIEANQYIDTLSLARLHYPSIKHDLGSLAERFCPTIPKLKENLDAVKGKHWDELTNQEKESLKTYCCNDVLITAKLYEHFINKTSQIELNIINHTIKTWINPTLILDTNKLTNVIIQEQEEINKKLKEINLTKENIRSDKKFYDYLKSKNYEPPLKFSTKQQKVIPAFSKTDSIFQEFYHNNPELQELLDLKRTINSNILESRTLKLLQASKYNNNRIPVGYNYYGAFTGRFSGANKLNMQNLPKKSPLRDAIMAPEGYKLIVCDLAQIEARVLAWLAGETKILEAFKNNRDLYSEVASKIFNRPINKHDNPDERFIGKCAVLGLGYGMSAPKFETFCALQGRKLDSTFCYNIVNTYRTEFCKIPELWHLLQEHIHILQRQQTTRINDKLLIVNDQIILPSSRRLRYEGVEYTDMWRLRNNKRIYGALIVENIVQAISRDILVDQLLTIHPIYPVVMHTHDELIVCVPEQTAQTALDFVLTTMKTPPLWANDLPLNAEANMGDRYGDCK